MRSERALCRDVQVNFAYRWFCGFSIEDKIPVVWISNLAALPPRASVARCDRAPERPLDCPSTNRSLRLATDATIYRSRSRLRLWQGCHPTASSNGYTGSADLATVALAKRILGEAHRLDPTGLS